MRVQKELPIFRYHPDPIATGMIKANADAICPCCKEQTGWVYQGHPYGYERFEDLCPWCIANGSAHEKLGVLFVPEVEGVSPQIRAEIEYRTPSFFSWQEETWLTHCNDGAAYLGSPSWEELQDFPETVAQLRADGWDDDLLQYIHPDGHLCACLFRCLHCDTHLVYLDCS